MHPARLLAPLAFAVVALFVSSAFATPTASLRWNACDDGLSGLPTDQEFGAPGVYTQVVSARGFDQGMRGAAFEIEVRAPGGLPDAWRFDAGGCQDGGIGFALAGVSKACPAIGAGTIVTSSIAYDPVRGTARVRYAAVLNATVTPNPATTYVLGKVSYDHANAVAGAAGAGQCGGVELPVCFQLLSASWVDAGGNEHVLPVTNALATWQNPSGASTCFAPTFPGVRVGELLPECLSADTTVQFVELVSTADGDRFDSHLRMRVRGADGTVRFDGGDFFGAARDGQPWPMGSTWLLATAGFEALENLAADTRIPAVLDAVGGTVEVYDARDPGTVSSAVAYGPGTANAAPQAGSSLARTGENSYSAGSPTPTSRNGASPATFLCPAKNEGVLLRSLGTSCAEGWVDGQYIEILAPTDQRFESTMRLVVRSQDGTIALDLQGLFPGKADGMVWPAGRSWLLAPLNFANRTGVAPDRIVPRCLDAAGGSVDIYGGPGGAMLLQHFAYGSGTAFPAPLKGYGLTRQNDGTYALDPAPAPRNFAGVSGAGSACYCPGPLCADSSLGAIRLDRVATACASWQSSTQFLVLRSTSASQTFQSILRIRVSDRHGGILHEEGSLFPGHADGSPWPIGSAWLIGGIQTAEASGVVPDLGRSTDLDTLGGTIMLYDPRIGGGVLQTLTYGPGAAVPAPRAGQSLVGGASGTWSLSAQQEPENYSGAHAVITHCPCPLSAVTLGFSQLPVYSSAARRDTADANAHASYDLALGKQVIATSGPGQAILWTTDLYTLTGRPPGQFEDFVASLLVTGGFGVVCHPDTGCDGGGGTAALRWNMTSSVRHLARSENSGLQLPLHVAYEIPFRLEADLEANSGGAIGTAFAKYQAVLSFKSLPPGASITSCNGYRQDQPVPTLPAILVVQPTIDAVHLEWTASPEVLDAAVERTSDGTGWTTSGAAAIAGDRFVFDDHDVAPGVNLGYRLRWTRGGATERSDVTWVDVPAARLALRALSANPSFGPVTLAYDLPTAGAARLELLDLRGRRAWSRELGVQAAGSHVASLAGGRLAAGVYWARVTLAGRQATLRLVVLGNAR